MNKFFRYTTFIFMVIPLTGGLLYLVQYIYFSDFTRAFDVVGILLSLILYSNLVAKIYGQTQKKMV
jgi:hypothetical protein